MKRSTLFNQGALLAVFGAGLALTACNQAPSASQAPPPQAALPLTTAAAPPIVDAPPATALPPAPRARVARVRDPRDRYGYADQAYAQSYGVGDAPPDYSFDYDGTRPWVWQSDDNAVQMVEPVRGGDRYYYYQPGQEYPYLVRDVDYTYGYDNGVLVVVYDREGRVMPPDFVEQRADYAGRYLYRGHDLYDASRHRQREAVAAANWDARRGLIAAAIGIWASQQNQQPDWRDYHAQHQDQEQAQWDQERYRREAYAARTDQMLNDQQAAQRALQASQQAQADARARGQVVAGGQQRSGFGGGLFGQRPNPAPAPVAPAGPQFGGPQTAAPGARPPYGQPQGNPGIQAQGPVNGAPGERNFGQPGANPAAQAEAQRQAQAQAQANAQAQAVARQQQEAAARAQADAARVATADQARLQAQAQAHQQQEATARAQADAAHRAAAAQAQQQARIQQQAAAKAQQQAAVKAQAKAQAPAKAQDEAKPKAKPEHERDKPPGTPSN